MKTVMKVVSTLNEKWAMGRNILLPMAAAFLLTLCLSPVASGAELEVRQSGGADHTTIQAAINAASPGDTITVLDSATYAEDVEFGALVPPVGPNGKPSITLQAAAGERPTIQAVNSGDRFGQGVADFNGLLVMSEGVTLKGLNILNGGDASAAALGLATALSIQAGNVTVIDCDISMAGGVVAPNTSVAALVSDLGRLGGLPDTVDNVTFTDCTIHDGTRIGMAVFPVAFALNPGVVGSVLHVTLERCVFSNNAGPGLEADGLGSVTLTDVTVETGGGNGMELAIEQISLTDCEALNNSGSGIVVSPPDQPPTPVTIALTANGVTCSGNGSDGLTFGEGTAGITNLTCSGNGDDGVEVQVCPVQIVNLVCATNGAVNLNFAPVDFNSDSLEVDHATLYHVPGDPDVPSNVQIDVGLPVSGPRLVLKNSILVGPVGMGDWQDLVEEDIVLDTCMFWNGGAAVSHLIDFTETNAVASVDPLLNDPPNHDYRLMATSPVATADDQGGPLGGAGIISSLPSSILIGATGIAGGQFFLEWEGTPNVTFDIRGGATMDSGSWTVIESVPGAVGTQHWDDTRPTAPGQFYGVEGR